MKRWIGRWIVGVGCVHSLFGLIVFRATWATLWRAGLVNTVNGQPEREFPLWFLATGILTILLGTLIDQAESRGERLPGLVVWGLLLFTIGVLVVMPISGGWLLVPAVAGAVWRSLRGGGPR